MMERYQYIEVKEFCIGHGVTTHFMRELHEFGKLSSDFY